MVADEAFPEYPDHARQLVLGVAEQLAQTDVVALIPKPPHSTFLGLLALPARSVACALSVAPSKPPYVIVAYEANPLYCPGPFYLVEPIGRSSVARRRYKHIQFPTIDLSPKAFRLAVQAVAFCVRQEFAGFRRTYGSPEGLLEALNRSDSVDSAEAIAYSLLRMGKYQEAAAAFREIARLKAHRVDPEDREDLPRAIGRAASVLQHLEADPTSIAAVLAGVEAAKLARYGWTETDSAHE